MAPLTPAPAEKAGSKLLGVLSHPQPPLTTSERLADIRRMRQRVNAHIDFMCGVDELKGVSLHAKDQAVAAFYDRLVALERQLDRVSEDLRLR